MVLLLYMCQEKTHKAMVMLMVQAKNDIFSSCMRMGSSRNEKNAARITIIASSPDDYNPLSDYSFLL